MSPPVECPLSRTVSWRSSERMIRIASSISGKYSVMLRAKFGVWCASSDRPYLRRSRA
jgi:hypothetical protein